MDRDTYMVVGRACAALTALAMAAAIAISSACVRRGVVRDRPPGSCDGACEHYMGCKRVRDPETKSACVRECRAAYETDGIQDTETLGHIEGLSCEDIIGMIEGSSGRAPGKGSAARPMKSR